LPFAAPAFITLSPGRRPILLPSRLAAGRGLQRASGGRMNSLIILITTVIDIYIWLLIASAILSWLVAFNVVNTSNRIVYAVGDFLYRITEPALRPIRRILPNLGGLDISPVVLILLLIFVRNLIWEYAI
jgi:YggT family protein